MSSLKKTPIAILIMIAAIVLSSFFGCLRSLLGERKAAEAYFFDSEDCIQGKLEIIGALTNDFKTIALRYVDSTDPRITEMVDARKALITAESIGAKYRALERLYLAVSALYSGLDRSEMNFADRSFHQGRFDDITAAIDEIEANPYNEAAREYNKILSGFPARYIVGIARLKPLELFGEYSVDYTGELFTDNGDLTTAETVN